MKSFQNINRDYVSPINLETLGKTYDTLEQGHKEAVKAASDLEVTIANMDLDESEDAWKQNKINEIKNTIAANTVYGNSYAALDDIIAKSGDLGSDAGLIGRLQANKEHKAFEAKVDAMDMPQDYKDMYKELNPYTYQDKIDKNGKVIGGTRWTPNTSPTKVIPMNQIMNQALQWAAKESGGGSQTKFIDANGNLSNTYTPGAEMAVFSTTTGSWQRLTKDKLRSAMEAAIANTPGAKESIDQDYKVQLWHASKNESNDITDRNGILMTKDQYLESRINPFYDAASFYNSTSSTTYNTNWMTELATRRASDSGAGVDTEEVVDKFREESVKSGLLVDKNTAPEQAQAAVTNSKIKLREFLGNDYIIEGKDIDTIKKDIDNIRDSNVKYNAFKALRDYETNNDYLNTIFEGTDSNTQGAIKTLLAITTGSDMPTDNASKNWVEKYNKDINNLFGSSNGLRQYFNNDDIYNEAIKNIGGIDAAKSFGFIVGKKDGKPYIECPKSSINWFYKFASANKNAIDNISNGTKTSGNIITTINSDGNENTSYQLSSQISPTIGSSLDTSSQLEGSSAYNKLLNYVDRLSNKKDKVIKTSSAAYEITTTPHASPEAMRRKIIYQNNSNSENKNLLTMASEDAMQLLRGGTDLTQIPTYVLDSKTNQYKKIDSNEAKKLTELLKATKNDDITLNFTFDPTNGLPSGVITLRGYNEKGEVKTTPTSFLVSGLFNSRFGQELMNDTSIRSMIKTKQAIATKAPLSLTNDMPNMDNLVMIPTDNGFNIVRGSGKDKQVINSVSIEQGSDIYDKILQYQDLTDYVRAGKPINETALSNLVMDIAKTITNVDGSNDSDIITYNAEKLLENLMQ